ncbi:hypothetical protein LUZ63_014177 [Rhynchospora breviuscula]|uniref:Reticulon-like protein n=1 Tax=Rhynchospora breviuscula TaxID=2022672 RepID=A0A9Q0CA49_9POAL|nr:hypothetical protein LUZ63_014177 [Rhynchospora breviuscula]
MSFKLKGEKLERIESATENIINALIDTLSDKVPRQNSFKLFEEKNSSSNSVSAQMNKVFGRQKTIHQILGGGKSADVLLWRNKRISSSVLAGATAVWALFEWLNYHFLTLICLTLASGMLLQFVWSNTARTFKSSSEVPRIKLPDKLFMELAVSAGDQLNQFLGFIQDISCGRSLKDFVMIVFGLWAASVIGSWCNFLTVLYIGFVSAHVVPVLYERYEDQVDYSFANLVGVLQKQYSKLDDSLKKKVSKRGSFKSKKSE